MKANLKAELDKLHITLSDEQVESLCENLANELKFEFYKSGLCHSIRHSVALLCHDSGFNIEAVLRERVKARNGIYGFHNFTTRKWDSMTIERKCTIRKYKLQALIRDLLA